MSIPFTPDRLHSKAKQNRWPRYFANLIAWALHLVFCHLLNLINAI